MDDRDPGPVHRTPIARTTQTAGKAIAFDASVVIGGFLVLLFPSFPPTRTTGARVSLSLFTCFVGARTLLPAVLNGMRSRACRVRWLEKGSGHRDRPRGSDSE